MALLLINFGFALADFFYHYRYPSVLSHSRRTDGKDWYSGLSRYLF
jgi:hypothetical protein